MKTNIDNLIAIMNISLANSLCVRNSVIKMHVVSFGIVYLFSKVPYKKKMIPNCYHMMFH